MKSLKFSLYVALIGFFFVLSLALAQTVLFETTLPWYYWWSNTSWGSGSLTRTSGVAIGYKPSSDQTVCAIKSGLYKSGNPADSVTLEVREDVIGGHNGYPTAGQVIGTATTPAGQVANAPFLPSTSAYTAFSFSPCFNFTAGTNYSFILSRTQPDPNNFYVFQISNLVYYPQTSTWSYVPVNGYWQETAGYEPALRLEGPEDPKPEPVIIVPGILGTELSNGDDLLWPDLAQMFGDIGDEFLSAGLAMTSDGESVNGISANKVSEIFLNHFPIFEVNIFQDLRQLLEKNNYVLNSNLFYFPYDWRLDLDKTKDLLKQKIDEVKSLTGFSKVNIIAHSMGGLLVKDYINQYGKNNIDKLIFVGTPHLGAPKAAKVLLEGDRFDIPWLAPSAVKAISLNSPAVYELLPDQAYFGEFTGYIKKHDSTDPLDYLDTKKFLIGKGVNWNLFDKAEALFGKNLQDINLTGVDAYNIAGCKTGTQAGYQYNSGDSEVAEIKYTSGDATVPLPSADYLNIPSDHKYYFKNGKHAELPSAEAIRNLIISLLKGQAFVLPSNLAQGDNSLCNFRGKELLWRSPVEIHVYDQYGNHTGPIENNAIEYGVPGADYEIIGHRKFVFLPTDNGQTYAVITKGLETGSFDLLVSENQNGDIAKTTVFNDVGITSLSVANLEVSDQSQDNSINLDKDGTGQFQAMAASAVLSAGQEADVAPPRTEIMFGGTKGKTGWYRSDVTVTLNSTDDLSGVLETKYSLDSGEFQGYSAPFAITAEGAHSVRYYSVDLAGNNEPLQTAEFKIDKVPPEFAAQFNPNLAKFDITGSDAADSNTETICGGQQCVAKDSASNETKLDFEVSSKQGNGNQIILKQIGYNGATEKFPPNSFIFKNFDQVISIKGGERVRVQYNQKANKSVIVIKEQWSGKPIKTTVDGVVLLSLFTQKGILDIDIK